MLVPHVPLQIELLELGEPAEAKQADDLAPQIVAEVALSPDALERAAVTDTAGGNLDKKELSLGLQVLKSFLYTCAGVKCALSPNCPSPDPSCCPDGSAPPLLSGLPSAGVAAIQLGTESSSTGA